MKFPTQISPLLDLLQKPRQVSNLKRNIITKHNFEINLSKNMQHFKA